MDPYALQTRMKRLFTEGFSVLDIAEPLASFDFERDARTVKNAMERLGIMVAGLRQDGHMVGYVERKSLTRGRVGKFAKTFMVDDLIPETASLPEVIVTLDRTCCAFVTLLGAVGAVVTRADVQKPAVRMWLFGMITIVEIYLMRQIEERYPDDGWQHLLSPARLKKSKWLHKERVRRQEPSRLIDCLQLGDKGTIMTKDPALRDDFGFSSVRQARVAVRDFESLRNSLAHTQDIVTHNWDTVVQISGNLETIMTRI